MASVLPDHHVNILALAPPPAPTASSKMRFEFELGDPSHLEAVLVAPSSASTPSTTPIASCPARAADPTNRAPTCGTQAGVRARRAACALGSTGSGSRASPASMMRLVAETGRLSGRVVLITGAESGIGRATAMAAGRRGGPSPPSALGREASTAWRRRPGWPTSPTPAAIGEAVESIVEELGGRRLDVVHANAGVLTVRTPVEELDLAEWHRVLATDLSGVLHTFQATLPHVTAPGGLLLVTGSSLALRPVPGLLPYVAAKAGAHAVARALALELAPSRIRVNVVAPGLTETPMTVGIPGHIEAGLAVGTARHPLVAAEEVAALAVHLMTDASRSITGSVFTVDGGRTAG